MPLMTTNTNQRERPRRSDFCRSVTRALGGTAATVGSSTGVVVGFAFGNGTTAMIPFPQSR
jgi:hypothetical protein